MEGMCHTFHLIFTSPEKQNPSRALISLIPPLPHHLDPFFDTIDHSFSRGCSAEHGRGSRGGAKLSISAEVGVVRRHSWTGTMMTDWHWRAGC